MTHSGIACIFDPEDVDEDLKVTGQYVVMGVHDEEDSFEISVAYGPFDDINEASAFGAKWFEHSWVSELLTPVNPEEE